MRLCVVIKEVPLPHIPSCSNSITILHFALEGRLIVHGAHMLNQMFPCCKSRSPFAITHVRGRRRAGTAIVQMGTVGIRANEGGLLFVVILVFRVA